MLRNKRYIYFLVSVVCLLFSAALAQDEFKYDDQGRRDPFIPLVTSDGRFIELDKQEAKGVLSLQGIIYDENGLSCAMVNGAAVRIGDVVGGSQVLKIEKNKVIFIKEGNTFAVELKGGGKK